MSSPDEIANPGMRQMWKDTKKAAGIMAGKKKQEKAYKAHAKQFNQDLGPNLKRWPGVYPNLGKMRTDRIKIEMVIKNYAKFNLVAKTKKTLDRAVLKILDDGLVELKENLATRTAIAESMLMGDEDLALRHAIKESKKTPLRPVVVFKSNDLSGTIMKMVPKAKPIVQINELKIEVILSDDKILKRVDDANGDIAQKIKDAADFAQLKKDIAIAYRNAAVTINKDASAFKRANSTFEAAVETAIEASTGRAGAELYRLVGIKTEYRNYRIISGVKLAATVVGTAAGAASLAMAPFTGPAMVISAVGVLKGAKAIGDQIADLSMSAEKLIAELKADMKNLTSRYKDWKGAGIGTAEVGSTLVNAIAPTIFPTIKRCASHCGTIGSKINGIEIKAGDISIQLNKTLDKQTAAQTEIKKWIAKNKLHVKGELSTSAIKLLTSLKANEVKVGKLIEKVSTLNTRVKAARADQKKLDAAIQALSAREPTIAKFAEVFIEIGASVAFLTSANVGWPDAYAITESAKAVSDTIGNVVGSLDGAVAAAEEVKGLIDDLRG